MTRTVFRIGTNRARSLDILAYGSTPQSGRWHVKPPDGLPVVHACSSRALCQLEKRVHCNGVAPIDLLLLSLELPDDAPLQQLAEVALLPDDWIDRQSVTRAIGVRWRQAGQALGLWVPSAVEPAEHNLLLNPDHPSYRKIKLTVLTEPFVFDPRMFD